VTRLGSVLDRVDEREPGSTLPLLSVSQTLGVLRRSEVSDKPPRAESLDAYKICRAGDIVFNKMSVRAGALGVAGENGLVTYHYEVMRVRNADPRYLVYLMKSNWFVGELIARERGIGAGDTSANVRTTEVPFRVLRTIDAFIPSLAAQAEIADYLDRETAQIDLLIAKQEQLIATLRERLTVSTSRLVTEGVGSESRLAQSGVPWLDAINARWRLVKIRHLADVSTGYGDTVDAEPEGLFPFYVRSQTPLRSSTFDHEGPAVLTAGDGAGVAKVFHLVHGKFKAHQRVYVIDNFRNVSPEFFLAYFSSFFNRVALDGSAKSTVDSVRRPMITEMPVPVPPPEEQREVVARVREQREEANALITRSERFIALARERRSALITSAVTGQINVHAAA
jgi:type I restriction enzyme S subunit